MGEKISILIDAIYKNINKKQLFQSGVAGAGKHVSRGCHAGIYQ